MHFSERLKKERERLGYSQTEFSKMAGATRKTLFNWEAGSGSPGIEALNTWSEVGLDVLYVVTGRRSVSYPTHAQSAVVTPIGATESSGLTWRETLAVTVDALNDTGRSLPSAKLFDLVDLLMAWQRAGARLDADAVRTQIRLVS